MSVDGFLQCGSAGTGPTSSSRFDHELIRRVRTAVRADPADVEDACSFAWIQFFGYQPDREREHLRAVVLINAAVGRHARAARLRELQDHTPEWLANTIGRVPPLIWTSVCQVLSTGCPRRGRASGSAEQVAGPACVRDARSG